ncbi:uncharacterized protein LOC121378727 [Gigantopelta aegis]|uniref:uncharacterized protein LOC121378727 n=1 Tax=Gigantopelta aegis TaxID=1735272 RepID=UPI001B887C7F|nr:uncharacterized protein LOC121378727 [Gigantopelta aegis]
MGQIASKELVQEPSFIKDVFFNTLIGYELDIDLCKVLDRLKPTTKRVLSLLDCEDENAPSFCYLKRYIRKLNNVSLGAFLRFTTPSDLLLSGVNDNYYRLTVRMVDLDGLARRPIAHTCGRVLELPQKYESFPQFRAEFNAILCICSYQKRFPRVESARLTDQFELLNDTTLMECAVKCGRKITCLAFNVNVNARQCELIVNPSFSDSKQSDPQWDYYGSVGEYCVGKKTLIATVSCKMIWNYKLVWVTVGLFSLYKGTVTDISDNVALNKPVTASTFVSKPELAVDGNNGTAVGDCFVSDKFDFSHTWMVDLLGTYVVDHVIITVPSSSYMLQMFFIEVFSQNPEKCPNAVPEICLPLSKSPLPMEQTTTLTCDKPSRGRFLRIHSVTSFIPLEMAFCEVEVYTAPENGCSFPQSFPRVESSRLLSQQTVLLNDTTHMECAVKCDRKITCLAFNVNVNARQCELIVNPSFNDSKQSDPQWNYYGSDLC